MGRSGIGLVIPALNEEATIFNVVKTAAEYGQPIVVSDGSTDNTALLAKQAGAVVIIHEINQGYDAALNSGFKKAVELGCEVIITLDADGQHDPRLLVRFIDEMTDDVDMVLGVRSNRPRLAEHIFAIYTWFRYGIQDPLCGMKAYRKSLYKSLGHFDSYNSIGTELMLHAARKHFPIKQIKFVVRDRLDKPRFGRILAANIKIIRAMFLDMIKL